MLHILLIYCLLPTVSVFAAASRFIQNQSSTSLLPNEPVTFVLAPAEEKAFVIHLREDDVAEISWQANQGLDLSFALYDPAGKDLVKEGPEITDSLPFVASLAGKYLLTIKMNISKDSPTVAESQKITLQYSNRLNIPTGNTSNDMRRINGYDVKILTSPGDNAKCYLLIEKNGRVKKVYKGGGDLAAGFYFADDLSHAYSAADKTSSKIIRSTIDKTGDGNPDVEVEYFTGGAHCCFVTFFFELGESVRVLPSIPTDNAELRAIGRTPQGSLRLETVDDIFAYWLASFAESPMPRVVLEFQKGALRPNLELMKKRAPSFIKLKATARARRAEISLQPYKGVDDADSGFEVVFWDTMLDLIYTGHEKLAWRYLDLVWPKQKAGKQIFIEDFKSQLAQSPFWQLIIESDNRRK